MSLGALETEADLERWLQERLSQLASATITGLPVFIAQPVTDPGKIAEGVVEGKHLVVETITAEQISAGTITGDRIAAGTIEGTNIAAATITGGLIAAGTITATNIAAGTIVAGNIAAHTITGEQIAAGTITTESLEAESITTELLAAEAVTAAKIAAGTITADRIAAHTLTSEQILAGSVKAESLEAHTITATQIAAGTITSTEIASATITGSNIAAATVTATNITIAKLSALSADLGTITAGTVTGATIRTSAAGKRVVLDTTGLRAYNAGEEAVLNFDIESGNLSIKGKILEGSVVPATTVTGELTSAQIKEIAAAKITGTITETQIGPEAINTPQLKASAVSTAKLAAEAVTAEKIAAGTITATQIKGETITAAQIKASTITTTQIAAETIVAGDIAANTITGAQIAAETITADRMSVTTLSTITTNAGTITAGTIHGAQIDLDQGAGSANKISWFEKGLEGTYIYNPLISETSTFTVVSNILGIAKAGAVQLTAYDSAGEVASIKLLSDSRESPKTILSQTRSAQTITTEAGGGVYAWSTIENGKGYDGKYATSETPPGEAVGGVTHRVRSTKYGFSIPGTATIVGVSVDVYCREGTIGFVWDKEMKLIKAGAITGNNKGEKEEEWPGSAGSHSFGGSEDLWGTTLTAAQVNAEGFGAALQASMQAMVLVMGGKKTVTHAVAELDDIKITVYYTEEGAGAKPHEVKVTAGKESAVVLDGEGKSNFPRLATKQKYFLPQVGCAVTDSTEQEVKNETDTTLTWNTEEYDDGECHSLASNTSRFTAPEDGIYMLTASWWWEAKSGAGRRTCYIRVNGSGNNRIVADEVGGANAAQSVTAIKKLKAGDYLEVNVWQSTGVTEKIRKDQYGTNFQTKRATFERIR